nr:uncharacterized protein LOC107375418 isoform X3 [Nothobranchius furzeri]
MSESIVRKVQPFTIGTRLSVPSVTKCQEFQRRFLPTEPLDNRVLQHNLNSLYLHRSRVRAHGSCLVAPFVKPEAHVQRNHEHMAAEDHQNQNVASPSAVSRSIKKITISGSKDRSDKKSTVGPTDLSTTAENKNNNNNNTTGSPDPHLPRIVGVRCENKPTSQFKVLLSKSSCAAIPQGETWAKPNGEKSFQISVPELQNHRPRRTESHPHSEDEAPAAANALSDSFTQQNSLFNKEALQAEAWIKSKLQDLKDGCNTECCPLQDWDEASQTLQRDLKDFENTFIQLNQMGEQLICRLNPTSDLVKKQLSQLKDQWQTLKQTATNQTRALGGAKSLRDFNRKADKLEAWVKEKEEEQSLVSVLGENVDKMQLTRKILDLKQDEQLHRNLHEEINSLALKLEKQGKAEGRNTSSRRKHINKMWLRVQSRLKNYHETLQQALEVSSFYQQADNTLEIINKLLKNISASKEPDGFGDRDIRDVASQIMMLDVSVSQLSSLHPDLVTSVGQKQTEIKDSWALLQRNLRGDKAALSPSGSTFTREHADLLTPTQASQSNMGSETHGIMGKEVKEEQNRLKGCTGTADCESGRQTQSIQGQEQQLTNHSLSPKRDGSFCANDAINGHPLKGERKLKAEPELPTAPRGHQQLQKFTVSADKTLSWLKDNVSMATQVCSIANLEGLEAAKRRQHALEREILNNRARIEVVKREGHGLVRAQHPGSAKIEEFLSQLEALWEELRRRHQRNAAFLQASEKLGFRIVKVLQALGSLEAWLESVELSMKESALAGDPETMSMAERESCLLEKEVAARSLELSALRQEVDRLHSHSHPHTRGLPARMEEVERKYHRVLGALTQQSSELQDTRMLTEFLERVELEESQESGRYSHCQPIHSDLSSAPTLLELRRSCVGDALMETLGDPVEELREAVEMLNDTVRERGRSQSHNQAVQELLAKHARLAVRVEECLCSSKGLSLDILEKETDLAVQCEPDRCGLGALQEKEDHQETDCEVVREEVKELEKQASWLKELCPEKAHLFEAKVQTTLEAWNELEKSVTENKSRLQEFMQLQDFFRSYLAMISWTEDTRSCIFSDTALQFRRDGQRPLVAELDVQMERKFKEFDELSVTAATLLDSGHHLTHMVRERMEELRSMLGWISVHWRVQKQQQLYKRNREMPLRDNIYSEATTGSPFRESSPPELEAFQPKVIGLCEDTTKASSSVPEQNEENSPEDGYETMNRIGPLTDSPKASMKALKESSSLPVGGAVNLIFSFGDTGNSQVQVLDLPARTEQIMEETSVHRVSTYLHVKDNNLAVAPVYESITLPRQKAPRDSDSLSSSSTLRSSPAPEPQTANVTFHPLARSGSSSIFSSLKRMSKKRKRKRDVRRHTIQKIMGVDEQVAGMHQDACKPIAYDTQTWPLKEERRKKGSRKTGGGAEAVAYMKNPLLKVIDTECSGEYAITPYAISAGPSAGPVKSHCRFLSLGSVLSFDLPKDVSLIPSIQDVITIPPAESRKGGGADPDPLSQRSTGLSSFRHTPFTPAIKENSAGIGPPAALTDPSHADDRCAPAPPPGENGGLIARIDDVSRTCFSQSGGGDVKSSTAKKDGPSQSSQASSCTLVPHKHECLSVHTLIRDLSGHRYHRCAQSQCEQEESPRPKLNQASHMRVNLKSTMSISVRQDSADSGISTSSSFKVCTDAADPLWPTGVVGRLVSLEVGGVAPSNTEGNAASSSNASPDPADTDTDPVHLDHHQFEEEEAELEDIWNQTTNHRQSICSDIMYQPNQEDLRASDQVSKPLCRSPTGTVLYRDLVTASAPNLLMAEFKLPSLVQSSLGHKRSQRDKDCFPTLDAGQRKSWAAFPNREPAFKTSVMMNETVSDQLKPPDMGDNPRYVYQYKEDEEEEEEVGEELEESGSYVQSVHAGSDGSFQQEKGGNTQEHLSTGGRCFTLSGKPELQSMEGTLERKHKLQLGGKKVRNVESDAVSTRKVPSQLHNALILFSQAASRGWSSYHAVLHRHTLCFFQDRKDTLRSSAYGLPLNLKGAECSPAPDYTKKPNCFRLRLRDGSEYLFNTSSRFTMKKWIMKIQASTGQKDPASLRSSVRVDQDLPVFLKPSVCFKCQDQASCRCSSQNDITSTFPRHRPTSKTENTETQKSWNEPSTISSSETGLPSDDKWSWTQSVTHRFPGEETSSSPLSLDPSSEEWLSSKRRSHSFTSATYQKIKPVLPSAAGKGLEKGSNYCVTVVVGDSLTNGSSGRSLDPPLQPLHGWQQDTHKYSALGSFASLPRPRNKSVFKKLFWKKDF